MHARAWRRQRSSTGSEAGRVSGSVSGRVADRVAGRVAAGPCAGSETSWRSVTATSGRSSTPWTRTSRSCSGSSASTSFPHRRDALLRRTARPYHITPHRTIPHHTTPYHTIPSPSHAIPIPNPSQAESLLEIIAKFAQKEGAIASLQKFWEAQSEETLALQAEVRPLHGRYTAVTRPLHGRYTALQAEVGRCANGLVTAASPPARPPAWPRHR